MEPRSSISSPPRVRQWSPEGVAGILAGDLVPNLSGVNDIGLGNSTPLEDQQLAGLLMWVPASLVFLG